MDYQGNVLAATTTTAGVVILPNTGGVPILSIVAIAATVTGVTLFMIQIGVALYSRRNG